MIIMLILFIDFMIRLHKVNNHKVVPRLPKQTLDTRPILGSELIPMTYATILALARKKSGKTQVIFDIIRHCVAPGTITHAFVATLNLDPTWLAIEEYCKENAIGFDAHTSTIDQDGGNILARLKATLDEEAKKRKEASAQQDEENEKPRQSKVLMVGGTDEQEDKVNRKVNKVRAKYQAPEVVIIFDDLSDELRSRILVKFFKDMRHYRAEIIIGTQYIHDLKPEQWKQVDYFLLFKGQSEDKLKDLYKHANIQIPFEQFKRIYEVATEQKYSFLTIDSTNQIFRSNFNREFDLEGTEK